MPAALYGLILFMAAVSYHMIQWEGIKINGKESHLAKSLGKDIKGKLSIMAYGVAIVFSLFLPMVSYLIYLGTAIAWIVPDKRLEKISKS